MKFELFDKKGVLQPIEAILAFLWVGFWFTITYCVLRSLDIYLPWWSEVTEVQNGLIVVFGLWISTKIGK